MKKSILSIGLVFLLVSCVSTPEKNDPIVETPPSAPSNPVDNNAVIAAIKETAVNSKIASYSWKKRGKAPLGYLKGMALVYARSICKPSPTVSSSSYGKKDALQYYGIEASNKNTYAFLIGLGMRESSGKHCAGLDTTANNVAANEAEAGLFQTSYNSSSSNPELAPLLKDYPRRCFLEEFSEKVTCSSSDWKYWGDSSSTGYLFQKTAKTCPAFAAEYAAITLRSLRNHYGPINRMEVEFRQDTVDLLSAIDTIVSNNPSVCDVL